MSATEYPLNDRDPRFRITMVDDDGGPGPSARLVVPDDPDEALAALNARAGEILVSQRIVAATTKQLEDAITLAEAELGVTYDVIRRRRRGLPDVAAAEVVVRSDSADVDVRARAILVERGLDPLRCTEGEYFDAAQAAVRGTT